jgi:SH3-like domain-containing protein
MGQSRVLLPVIFVLVLAATVWSALGAMSVQVKSGQIRNTPSFLGNPVGAVAYGDQVDALQQQGDWFEVNAAGKKGWIHQSALTKKKVTFSSGAKDAKVSASGEEIALAGKGFNADVEAKYRASHRNVDFTWVDRIEQIEVTPAQMVAFLKEGGVRPQTGGAK